MVLADPFAIHQACLQWAHSILSPHPVTVSLHFPSTPLQAATSPACALPSTLPLPGVQLQTQQGPSEQPLPDQAPAPDKPRHKPIVCRVVSEVAHMSSVLAHPLVCACHGKQVQQQQQALADGMQQSQAICPVSGRPLTPAQTKSNDSMVQVRNLQLPVPDSVHLLTSPGKLRLTSVFRAYCIQFALLLLHFWLGHSTLHKQWSSALLTDSLKVVYF